MSMNNDKKNCFVIMPFGRHFDGYYEDIYKPAIIESGLNPHRADDLYKSSPIINDIWNYVITSDIIVADLSEKNPNVMYELGLAHAVAKPVVLISNNIDSVPFDLKYLRILLYNPVESNWSDKLKSDLKNYLQETLSSPYDSILPTFINTKPNTKEDISEFQREIIEIRQILSSMASGNEQIRKYKSISQMTPDEYSTAIKDAHRLYYEDGLDLSGIRDYISNKYRINNMYSADIVNTAIK